MTTQNKLFQLETRIKNRELELRGHLTSASVTKASAGSARKELEALKVVSDYMKAKPEHVVSYIEKTIFNVEVKLVGYAAGCAAIRSTNWNMTLQKNRLKELAKDYDIALLNFQLKTLKPLIYE